MAKLNRSAIAETHFQAFRGGLKKLGQRTKALLRGTCCTEDMKIQIDRLPPRMRFDNGLAHENPNGANQKWIFQHDPDKTEIAKHFTNYGTDATVGVIAPPSYALITHIAVSVGDLPHNMTFTLGSRFGALNGATGTLHRIITSGASCSPDRDYDSFDGQSVTGYIFDEPAKANGELRKDFIFVLDKPVFMAQADEITISPNQVPSGVKISETDFDVTVAVNYDFVIRSEV